MTIDIGSEIERAIGHGPAHRPVAEQLAAGRSAARRRRRGQAACAVAVIAMVATGSTTLSHGRHDSQSDTSAAATQDLYADVPPEDRRHEPILSDQAPVAISLAGELVTLPGVRVTRTVENPLDLTPPGFSIGVEFTLRGETQRRLLHADATTDGAVVEAGSPSDKSFDVWVAEAAVWAATNREAVGE
jgi:hypothetical protein